MKTQFLGEKTFAMQRLNKKILSFNSIHLLAEPSMFYLYLKNHPLCPKHGCVSFFPTFFAEVAKSNLPQEPVASQQPVPFCNHKNYRGRAYKIMTHV